MKLRLISGYHINKNGVFKQKEFYWRVPNTPIFSNLAPGDVVMVRSKAQVSPVVVVSVINDVSIDDYRQHKEVTSLMFKKEVLNEVMGINKLRLPNKKLSVFIPKAITSI